MTEGGREPATGVGLNTVDEQFWKVEQVCFQLCLEGPFFV